MFKCLNYAEDTENEIGERMMKVTCAAWGDGVHRRLEVRQNVHKVDD